MLLISSEKQLCRHRSGLQHGHAAPPDRAQVAQPKMPYLLLPINMMQAKAAPGTPQLQKSQTPRETILLPACTERSQSAVVY